MSCVTCEGRGFVLETRIINELPYEFILHCECPAGNQWRYNGRTVANDKSLYFVQSVSFRGGEVDLRDLPKEWQEKKVERQTIKGIMGKIIPESKANTRPRITPEQAEQFYL